MCFIHDIDYDNRKCRNCGKRDLDIYDSGELFAKKEYDDMAKDIETEALQAELIRLNNLLAKTPEIVSFKVRLQRFLYWVWPAEETCDGKPHTHGSRFYWFMVLSWFIANIARAGYVLPKVAIYGFGIYAVIVALCCFVDWLNDQDCSRMFNGWLVRFSIILFGAITTVMNFFMFMDTHFGRRAYE